MFEMRIISFSLAIFSSVSLLSIACSEDKDEASGTSSKILVQPELLRIQASNYTALVPAQGNSLLAVGATKTTSVTIKSLKYPIGNISLSAEPPAGQTASASGSNGMPLYECTGTNNESCLVELTGDALTNLLSSAPAKEGKIGTYSQVNISPCFQGGSSSDVRVKLTAEATINGVLYYSNATTGLSTTGPAEEVTFSPNGGCNSARYLTKDIVISEESFVTKERPVEESGSTAEPVTSGELTEQLKLKLYFDLANAVVAAGPSTDPNAANETSNGDFCKGRGTRTDPYICINFPEIVGTIDSGTPTLTRMLINSHTIWGFYSNSDSKPFGAYQRSYYNGVYSSSSEPAFLVGSMFERFQVNANGSVSFKQYDDGQNRHLTVTNFTLSDHTGTMRRGTANESLSYTAVKLP